MKLFIYIFLVLGIVACSSDEKIDGKTAAEVLFKEAKQLKEDKHFIMANEKLNEIKSKYPYSIFSTDAELMQADILFEQESFAESAAAYLVFKDFHPTYKDSDYVVYKIASSNYNLIPPTVDRDLASAIEAIKYFKELLLKFPSSKYIDGAKDKIESCERMLREKDQYIADFYFRTKVYTSSYSRYLEIVNSYKDSATIAHALKGALLSLAKQGNEQECVSKKNDFNSSHSDLMKKIDVDCKSN